jgi:uncharacterized protein with von Willebrand factor type A (vWA) domain
LRRLSQKSFSEGYNEVSARFEAEALRLAPVGHGGGASSRESVSLPHPLSKVENPGFLRGRLIASTQDALMRTDLRTLVSPEDVAEAERIAERLARAMRYRLSRRRMPACRGDTIDLRRTMRRNLSRGGEPIELRRKHRPERPFRLVVLLDVSGSMKVYSRFFLSFVRGLIGQWLQADAFLFHTRFVRVTEVLRERDASRAMGRLSLMTEGFGGGTRIAASLKHFNDRYAKEALNSRSVVIIMSDGYDTDPAEALTVELNRLKGRARRLVWLNPLLGWKDYAPVARAMAAALDHIDCFATAHSLASLAALEDEFRARAVSFDHLVGEVVDRPSSWSSHPAPPRGACSSSDRTAEQDSAKGTVSQSSGPRSDRPRLR